MNATELLSKVVPLTWSGQIPFDQWLNNLEDLFDLISPAPKQEWKVAALKFLLHGNAKAFFDQQEEVIRKNYPAIVALLKQKFVARAAKSLANQKLYTVCQSHDQGVGEFANQIRELVSTASIGDDPAVIKYRMNNEFIRGLKPSIRIMVKKEDPTDFEQALEMATRFEGLLEEEHRAIPANTFSVSYSATQDEVTQSEFMWMREQIAMLSDQVREANRVSALSHEVSFVEHFERSGNRRCYKCRGKGHLARECIQVHVDQANHTGELSASRAEGISHDEVRPISETRVVESYELVPSSASQDSSLHAELQEIKREMRGLSLIVSVLVTHLTGTRSEEFLKQRSEILEPETSMEPAQKPSSHSAQKAHSLPAHEEDAAVVQQVTEEQKSFKNAVIRGQPTLPTDSQVNGKRQCYRCGINGHLARNCKSEPVSTEKHNCTFPVVKQPEAAAGRSPSPRSVQSKIVASKKCYRCGGHGHFAKACVTRYGHVAEACATSQWIPERREEVAQINKGVGFQGERGTFKQNNGIKNSTKSPENRRSHMNTFAVQQGAPSARLLSPASGVASTERGPVSEGGIPESEPSASVNKWLSQNARLPDQESH